MLLMSAQNTLYLLPDEERRFAALPESVREGWVVVSEAGRAFEDAAVLKVRANMARFEKFPELRSFVTESIRAGKADASTIKTIPESILPELYFTIGARGVTMLRNSLFASVRDDADVGALAGFSRIRHDILATNASISYS